MKRLNRIEIPFGNPLLFSDPLTADSRHFRAGPLLRRRAVVCFRTLQSVSGFYRQNVVAIAFRSPGRVKGHGRPISTSEIVYADNDNKLLRSAWCRFVGFPCPEFSFSSRESSRLAALVCAPGSGRKRLDKPIRRRRRPPVTVRLKRTTVETLSSTHPPHTPHQLHRNTKREHCGCFP